MKRFFIVLCSLLILLTSCKEKVAVKKVKEYRVKTGGFIPRLSAPDFDEISYYEDNIFYKSGYGMPNCTAYAWGRVYEILNKKPGLCPGNARLWYAYNISNKIYKFGKKPIPGAVACFDNEYGGHVAVVEVIKDGIITFSNSAYKGSLFYLSYAGIKDKNPGQKGWIFQGYIYPKYPRDTSE